MPGKTKKKAQDFPHYSEHYDQNPTCGVCTSSQQGCYLNVMWYGSKCCNACNHPFEGKK